MEGFSLVEMWENMGWPVRANTIFLGILSVYCVFAIIERLIVYGKSVKQSYSYVLALRDYLAKRKIAEAINAASAHPGSAVAKVVGSGLTAYKQGREALEEEGPDDVGDFDLVDSVNRSLERVKERETTSLRKRLGGLATIASIAPFVGLFGTVLGIINAFQLLSEGGGIAVVGPGIAEALISTAFGLLVAIPAAMFFNYFTQRVENMVVDMNDVSSEFIDYVLREGRV
jgi:biopolymer transport protein ExbB